LKQERTKQDMTESKNLFLVFGGTGRTGRHFISLVLKEGHRVRALVRNPEKMGMDHPDLEVLKGSITDSENLAEWLKGADYVISMLGDAEMQKTEKVNTAFVKKLIPAMRAQGVKRFLYQAGGFSRPYKERLTFIFWLLKQTLVRFSGLLGQHRDNEGVIDYLAEQASDIDWVVHRASIISDDPSKGLLIRSRTKNSLATFTDCASYNYALILDDAAIHTCELSQYA
jgi:hypothetical protein